MTVAEALAQATRRLRSAKLPDAGREAEYLLAAVLEKPRLDLLLNRNTALSASQAKKVQRAASRRANRWPLAYIVGHQPFADFSLRVTPAVLIPRPETEDWVERLLERIQRARRLVEVADIGTGSGCIAIRSARSPQVRNVWAVDRSPAALAVARKNARALGVAKKCHWLQGNLAHPLEKAGVRVDYLLANLPYVAAREMTGLAPEVLHEPQCALFGGKDGLDLVRKLVQQAPRVLNSGGQIVLEIGIRQARAVEKMFKASGGWEEITFLPDLSGIMRVAQARLRG